ncbi:hypothetical protein CDD80_5629 [Ophiocordyceps camponoti-rufipedis]|uniref:LYC1 C-terminal domain-containing protein n=1 Tax=Ophiocordyceps camponoti-rufipedis TaxID=2004952 RepID=A0A2C5YV91_9HYPO|nr:hypothetical protein CDD80_5629 [Ophiocordyceps camponoti-rufipedis]
MLFVLFEAINGDAPKAEAHLRNGQRVLDACAWSAVPALRQQLGHVVAMVCEQGKSDLDVGGLAGFVGGAPEGYTHPHWGAHLTAAQYHSRERHLLSTRLASSGGLTPWILTSETTTTTTPRPVLASCETIRKRALVRPAGSDAVISVGAQGVASVFVREGLRGRGYAARMMGLLAEKLGLEGWDAPFSILYSDIGPEFYARCGWKPHASSHLILNTTTIINSPATPIHDADLPSLTATDELRLKHHLARLPPSPSIRAALIPDLATLQWHFARQDFLAGYQFHVPPRAIRGALLAGASPVWAVWKPHLSEEENGINTLEFLRLSYEDDIADQALSTALQAIVEQASHEAQTWRCKRLLLWNPDARVRNILSSMTHLQPTLMERTTESIASLLWLAEGGTDAAVEWIANEKFGWC